MPDAHANFAYSTIATAPNPAATGTSLVVQTGDGAIFPTPPFNATVWPAGEQPTSMNSEIVRVTAISTDTFTITRIQEGTSERSIIVGDQIAATLTAAVITDAEDIVSSMSPYILASAGTAFQTLISATSQTGTASLYVFPITVQGNIQFNRLLIPNSYSYITSNQANSIQASHYSLFGLYSMNNNTLSLISSNSFSIGETLQSVSLTWNFPTSTGTQGYGYGPFVAGNLTATAQMSSYISGSRVVGLQFGADMNLTGGMYWLGLLYNRSTAGSATFGLSHAGILGQIINPINSVGSVSGLLPFGIAGSEWTNINTHSTGWWGRHIIGFVTATSITNQLGTAIPNSIELSALGAVAANSTVSVLPAITFASTKAVVD